MTTLSDKIDPRFLLHSEDEIEWSPEDVGLWGSKEHPNYCESMDQAKEDSSIKQTKEIKQIKQTNKSSQLTKAKQTKANQSNQPNQSKLSNPNAQFPLPCSFGAAGGTDDRHAGLL